MVQLFCCNIPVFNLVLTHMFPWMVLFIIFLNQPFLVLLYHLSLFQYVTISPFFLSIHSSQSHSLAHTLALTLFHYFKNFVFIFFSKTVKASGVPYWAPPSLLRLSATTTLPLLTYVEPAYFYDTNEFCCIVGTNIFINEFESVLSSYDIAKAGTVANKHLYNLAP